MQTNTPSNFTLADGAGHTFFMRQPKMAQKAEHRRGGNLHSGRGKPGLQFQQCQVRLFGDPSLDPLRILVSA